MKKIILAFFLLSSTLYAQDFNDGQEVKIGNKKVIYTYKKYEKFDFDDLDIDGTAKGDDLSISPIEDKRYSNRLPYRKSFTVEIKKGIERVR